MSHKPWAYSPVTDEMLGAAPMLGKPVAGGKRNLFHEIAEGFDALCKTRRHVWKVNPNLRAELNSLKGASHGE